MIINDIIVIILLLIVINSIYLSFYKENNIENFGMITFNDVGLKCLNKNSPLYKPYQMTINNEDFNDAQCIPDIIGNPTSCRTFPNTKNNGTDCYHMNSDKRLFRDINNVESKRIELANAEPNFYFNCKGKLTNDFCKSFYDANNFKTTAEKGFACNVGNKTIPIINNNNILSCPSNNGKCVIRSSVDDCNVKLNYSPVSNEVLTCDKGKIGDGCIDMYDRLGLKSLSELEYKCYDFKGKKIVGKLNDDNFIVASYDGINPIENCDDVINFQNLSELKPIQCSMDNIKTNKLCEEIYEDLNLYPTNNKLAIRGNNIRQSIPLMIDDDNILYNLAIQYNNGLAKFDSSFNINDINSIKKTFQKILDEYPIKIGCCNRKNKDINDVQISNIQVSLNTTKQITDNNKKFNYQPKNLKIPSNLCNENQFNGSEFCDLFYAVKCANDYMEFKKLNLSDDEYTNYNITCSCYAPKLNSEKNYPYTIPKKCYKNNCNDGGVSYLDPISRSGTCNLTICNSMLNLNGIDANNISLNSIVNNNCGNLISSETINSTPINSTPINSTPINSTPINSTPINSTPINSTPINSTSINSTPINSTPINSTPINSTPINSTPINSTPINNPIQEQTESLSEQKNKQTNTQINNQIIIIVAIVLFILFIFIVILCYYSLKKH
jgi:hypothetical protein